MAQQKKQNSNRKTLGSLSALSELVSLNTENDKESEREALRQQLDAEKASRIKRSEKRPAGALNQDDQLRLRRIKEQKDAASREGVKRHFAKAAGVKSVFRLSKTELFMTSFGKGAKADPEKHIVGKTITTIPQVPAFSAEGRERYFDITGRLGIKAQVDNPLFAALNEKQDLIGAKSALEKEYFGCEFEDNIHIQLIHNIQDIDKILAVHINNIVYALNNMLREDGEEHFDIIGYLNLGKTWDGFLKLKNSEDKKWLPEMLLKLLKQPQLLYYGTVLYDPEKVKKLSTARNDYQKETARRELDDFHAHCYNLLTLIGALRQATAHGAVETRSAIYTLDSSFDGIAKKLNGSWVNQNQRIAARDELDKMYASLVNKVNSDFLENSKVDLKIIFSLFDAVLTEEKQSLARAYYDFVVRKEFKNQGFSFTRLRENMVLATDARRLMSNDYDSMRGRLYRHFDFILFRYYQEHTDAALSLVNSLRATLSESEKEAVYKAEALRVWPVVCGKVMDELLPFMNGDEIKTVKADSVTGVDISALEGVAISPRANAFSELIYLLTRLLDGKEINDLLTTLINKFDNITSLRAVLKDRGIKLGFTDSFRMFGQSEAIAKELRVINSFARMDMKNQPDAKRILFIEAAQVLGYPHNIEQLTKYIDNALTEQGEFAARGKDFRNFIASNVIESDRFKYVVRYGNPAKLREITSNPAVVDFVLKGIPDTQIIRYYNSCLGMGKFVKEFEPSMRDELRNVITGISFEDFSKVRTKNSISADLKADKARKQAVISLYLTVLYLTVKNLIYVNSRYYLAFHCLERDAFAYGIDIRDDMRELARVRIPEQYKEKPGKVAALREGSKAVLVPTRETRVREYQLQNLANSDMWAVRSFRNCAEHIGAVRNADKYIGSVKRFNSWFELYHCLVQRYLIDQYAYESTTESRRNPGTMIISASELSGKTLEYMNAVKLHGGYCKDFVKALNAAFAYNLPRFKNLSIDELFDRNNYLPKKAEKI